MLKIGDFSKLTRVSVRMLRYYDKQGLLKPEYTDPDTGYRMYTSRQVPKLQKIVLLRDLDFGVADIRQLLEDTDDTGLVGSLSKKIGSIEAEIKAQKERIDRLRNAIEHINAENFDRFYNVTIKAVEPCPVVSLRRRVESYFDEGALWQELMEYVHRKHIDYERSAQNGISVYHDSENLKSGVDIEVCLKVKKPCICSDGFSYGVLPGVEQMASMMVYGPYENISAAYRAFAEWLEKNQLYSMKKDSRQIAIIDPDDTDDPQQYLTEIQIPLRKRQQKSLPLQ